MIRRAARALLRRWGIDVAPPAPTTSIVAAPAPPAAGPSPTPWFTGLTDEHLASLPDARFYVPRFSPWLGHGDLPAYLAIAAPYTMVSDDRCYVLVTLARQALALRGDFVECGVYKGGTAMLLAKVLADARHPASLHLFDTFAGMPDTDPSRDMHQAGDFADTSASAVRGRVDAILRGSGATAHAHAGRIPDTFAGVPLPRIAFAHVDVDIHRSVIDCCTFVYPRLVAGGVLVFDDYGFPTCPGARAAVDEFFADKRERPLVLATGQAIVHKLPADG